MKIKISEVKNLLINTLIHFQIPKPEAIILAEDYLNGELEGKFSHGLMAFPALIKRLPLPKKKIKIKKETASYVFADANGNLGAIVGRQFALEAIKKAKKQGVAIALISNMKTWLRPGTIAKYVADHDMIGFVVNSGGSPAMCPPGGYTPQIGTNPIGIGIPTDEKNIVIDMATSKKAWGEVRKALLNNTELPPETFFDKRGNFTRDPNKADAVVPAGDYKGFALGLFIEILAGSLIGMPMSGEITDSEQRSPLRGAIIIVIDPLFSTSIKKFKQENKRLIKKIKKSKKISGVKNILIPGERATANLNKVEKNGYIEIKGKMWKRLKEISDKAKRL